MAKTTPSSSRQYRVWLIAIAILALLFGLWAQHNLNKKANKPIVLTAGTLFPQPRAIAPFQLTDDYNKPFTNANLKGHWSLVFFGFTHCPMLCPTTLTTLNQAFQSLTQAKQQPMPQVVFISVDPERDTPKRIRNYLISFNKDFIGTTGKKANLDALTQQFNVMYAKVMASSDAEANEYSIDHSGTILLVDPNGQLYAVFSTPHDPQKIAADIATITSTYQPQTQG